MWLSVFFLSIPSSCHALVSGISLWHFLSILIYCGAFLSSSILPSFKYIILNTFTSGTRSFRLPQNAATDTFDVYVLLLANSPFSVTAGITI